MGISTRPRALYQRIADKVRAEIMDGTLPPGERLPTEAEISAYWHTSRSTAVKGLGVLINEGLIVSDRPRGYFVRERHLAAYRPQAECRRLPLTPEMDALLRHMTAEEGEVSQAVGIAIVEPPPEVRERLQLPEGALAVVRRQTHFIDGIPLRTEDTYYPLDLVHGNEIMFPVELTRGANVVLTELGYEQVRVLDEIHVRMPTPDEADRLQLSPGTPIAAHICTGYTATGQPVRTMISCLPGDRHIITYERITSRPGTELSIRTAAANDLGTVRSLWEEAAAWLNKSEATQGQDALCEDEIRKAIRRGACYLVEDGDGASLGTMTADQRPDADLWTASEVAESAFYVHGLAMPGRVSGTGLGDAMLDWAGRRAQAHHARWLRVDTWPEGEGLLTYYFHGRGFEHVRTVRGQRKCSSGLLFQRPANHVPATGPVRISREEQ